MGVGFLRSARARLEGWGRELLRLLGEAERAVLAVFKRSGPATEAAKEPDRRAFVPEGRRVYAVGDIHGRADLLGRLLEQLEEDAKDGGFEGKPILVFLGDYVDRGFQSKEVIDLLLSEKLSQFETYFLKGNHEAAMMQFLHDAAIGPRWAEFGGMETLVSYGVRPPRTRTSLDEWAAAAKDFGKKLPAKHREFLDNLDITVRIGDYIFVHAGVRPGVPLDQQSEQDMLWIREDFLGDRRHFEAVVVHGHTPASAPFRDNRRIGIDTGAYLSGRLTAARFDADRVSFIVTGPRLESAASAA